MTIEILFIKIATIIAVTGSAAFIYRYHRRTHGAVWRDLIGLSILVSSVWLIGESAPFGMAVFFHLSPRENKAGAWIFIGSLLLGGIWQWLRFFVWKYADPAGECTLDHDHCS